MDECPLAFLTRGIWSLWTLFPLIFHGVTIVTVYRLARLGRVPVWWYAALTCAIGLAFVQSQSRVHNAVLVAMNGASINWIQLTRGALNAFFLMGLVVCLRQIFRGDPPK
jgi:hypothetical protein